jgi:hypothetical protein
MGKIEVSRDQAYDFSDGVLKELWNSPIVAFLNGYRFHGPIMEPGNIEFTQLPNNNTDMASNGFEIEKEMDMSGCHGPAQGKAGYMKVRICWGDEQEPFDPAEPGKTEGIAEVTIKDGGRELYRERHYLWQDSSPDVLRIDSRFMKDMIDYAAQGKFR